MFGLSSNPGLESATLTFGNGAVVAGPYKEAQKFLRILLSDTGSIASQPGYGAGLFKRLNFGLILNESQFRVYFSSAKAKALEFMRIAKQKDGVRDPRFLDDEALTDVAIHSITISPGVFKLTLKFTFVDPDIDIIIPVGVSVGT